MKTIRVRRLLAVAILAGMLTASFAIAQKDDQAELLMQAAHQKQLVEGQLEEAIQLYKRIVQEHAGNRAVAAKALLEMGQCYEKLGKTEARNAYERVLRDYADQNEAAAQARTRLAALSGNGASRGSEMVTRRVWAGPGELVLGTPSSDGRYLSYADWTTGDLALRDLVTGTGWNRFARYATGGVYASDSLQRQRSHGLSQRLVAGWEVYPCLNLSVPHFFIADCPNFGRGRLSARFEEVRTRVRGKGVLFPGWALYRL